MRVSPEAGHGASRIAEKALDGFNNRTKSLLLFDRWWQCVLWNRLQRPAILHKKRNEDRTESIERQGIERDHATLSSQLYKSALRRQFIM